MPLLKYPAVSLQYFKDISILLQGEALVAWLQALAENLALLKPKLEPFVLATLDIPWADKEKPIVAAFTYV